jgi:SNF2 family DNA or RNA helicase
VIHVSLGEGHLVARVDLATEATLVSQVPGARYQRKGDWWKVPLTLTAWVQLDAIAGDGVSWVADVALSPALDALRHAERRAWDAKQTAIGGDPDAPEGLFPHQAQGLRYLRAVNRAVLADEPGVGKTAQAAAALVAPALVVCPPSLTGVWADELAKWRPELTASVVTGAAAKRRQIVATRPDVLIVSFPLVWRHSRLAGFGSNKLARCATCDPKAEDPVEEAKCEHHPRELNETPFATVIVDEAQNVLSTSAKQTRATWAVADAAERVYALTGTPVRNRPTDLWALMRLVHPGEWPVRSKYTDRYCTLRHNAWGGVVDEGFQPETKAELDRLIAPRFLRRTKAEVLPHLPPKTYSERRLDMEPKQAKAYKQMRDTMLHELDDGSLLVAPNPMLKVMRLLQFAAATPVSFEDEAVELGMPSCKVAAMLDLADERQGQPTVAFSVSKKVSRLTGGALGKAGYRVDYLDGDVAPGPARAAVVERFQSGALDWVLCTYAVGGEGLTLHRADTLVRVQRPWSVVQDKQAEDRIHRIGQEAASCHYIDLVTKGTNESRVIKALTEKSALVGAVCRDEERIREYLEAA